MGMQTYAWREKSQQQMNPDKEVSLFRAGWGGDREVQEAQNLYQVIYFSQSQSC